MIDKWNQRYREKLEEGQPPLPFLVDALEKVPPGRALDIACGLGRHSLWLARRGWRVTALDGSEVAISRVREQMPEVEAIEVDIEAPGFRLPGTDYDLIVDTFFLHRPLFPQIRAALREGGIGVLAFHLEGRFAISISEVDQLREDYQVLHYVVHKDIPTVELVLQKPRSY